MAGPKFEINPFPRQAEAWRVLMDKTTTEIVFGGGAHGGKSRLGCEWLIYMCFTYPGTRYLMGREHLNTLKKTTLETFFAVCKEFKLKKDRDYWYNQQSNKITFFTDAEILLWDMAYKPSDPTVSDLGSLELTGAFIDEAAELHPKMRMILNTRLRFKHEQYDIVPKLLMTCNPCKTFLYTEFYQPWKDGTLASHQKFIPSLASDNPHTPKSYMDQLDRADEITRARLRDGKWEYDDDPTCLISYDDIRFLFENRPILLTDDANNIVATRTKEKDYSDVWITVDVARMGADKTCVIRWVGLAAVEVHLFAKEKTDYTSQFVRDLMDLYGIPAKNVIVDAGGIGGGFADQIKGCREFVFNARALHNDNYKSMKDQMYYALADTITKREMFVKLAPGEIREMLAKELEFVKRAQPDKEGKLFIVPKDVVKRDLGRSPDISDALMLRMLPVVEKRKPFRQPTVTMFIDF